MLSEHQRFVIPYRNYSFLSNLFDLGDIQVPEEFNFEIPV